MTLQMMIWQHDTGVNGKVWAGQVMDGEQQAVIDKLHVPSAVWRYAPVHVAPLGGLRTLGEKLLTDWRAAEKHAT